MPCAELTFKECSEKADQGYEECTEEKDLGYEQCEQEVDQGYEQCTEEKDQGYEQCTQEVDQGYVQCTEKKDLGYNKCCTWIPCKWACKAYVWVSNVVCVASTWVSNIVCVASTWISNVVCVASTWVSNIVCVVSTWISNVVCVASTWISNVVCVAWNVIKVSFCTLWDFATTVVGAVFTTILSLGGWFLNALSFVINLFFLVPVIGRFVKWVWEAALTVFWGLVGFFDAGLCAIGICPEKKLRLCVIVLKNERDAVVVEPANVLPHIQNTINLYRNLANVRVIPVTTFKYTTPFSDGEQADESWVRVAPVPSKTSLLDVHCGGEGFLEDFGSVGASFDAIASTTGFKANFQRTIGYSAPVIAFYVRSIEPNSDGCSLGPLTDYITIESDPLSIALPHEVGHACNLWHVDGSTNLMNGAADYASADITLAKWQVLLLRASRHVTYL